jgi:hypothetical protein
MQARPVGFDLAANEGLDTLVELTAGAGDMALGDPAHSKRLDQVVHRAGGDALDVGLSWMTAAVAVSASRRGNTSYLKKSM